MGNDWLEAQHEASKGWHDPELKAAYEIARRYENDHKQKIKAYAAGWPQLVNWQTCGQGASQASFTTLQNIGLTQQPNIPANSTNPGGTGVSTDGTYFHVRAFGIVGSAAGTATTTFGVNANGGATGAAAAGTAIVISAAQTPATSTVQLWRFEMDLTILTVGSAGTLQAMATMLGNNATQATNVMVPATQPAAPAWNSTQANYFNLVASWSASAAGNLYQVNGFAVLQFN